MGHKRKSSKASPATKRAKRKGERISRPGPQFPVERVSQLQRLFPEVVSEGRVDFDKLRAALGAAVDERPERYSFTWAGKQKAILELQKPTWGTLVPARKESVNFDTTQNLFIEGENLEVLRLLYKAYFGRVKLIYTDPPYNTGNDFVYPDNFADPKEAYLRLTGQKDAEGNLLTSNPESSGRYHSAWLSMMYPRLFLARQLLRDDGVILVSIDDHEVHNLRLVMNEIFGEENFVAQLVWEKGRKNDAKLYSVGHEYMVVYARSLAKLRELKTVWREPKPGAKEIWGEYLRLRAKHGDGKKADTAIEADLQEWYRKLPDTNPAKKLSRYKHVDQWGPWRDRDISWPGGGGPRYKVPHHKTGRPCKVPERGWGFASLEEMLRQIELGLVEFRDDHTKPPFRKANLRPRAEELTDDETAQLEESDENENGEEEAIGMQVMGSYIYKQSQVAVKYLRRLLGGKYFDNPKDHEVLARIFRYCTTGDDLIFDFFGGSGTTAEAVLAANESDGGSRRFVIVQLPQPTAEKSAARKAGFRIVSEIAKKRIKKALDSVSRRETQGSSPNGPRTQDKGIACFALETSSFKPWPGTDATKPDEFTRTMELFADPLLNGWKPEPVIYEVALREGFGLTARLEKLSGFNGNTVWRVTDADKSQSFRICLDDPLQPATVKALALQKDELFICRDVALTDKLAANLALQCRLKTI